MELPRQVPSSESPFQRKQKREYDKHHAVRDQTPITDNSDVWVTTGEQPTTGTVRHQADAPRSYIIDTPAFRTDQT